MGFALPLFATIDNESMITFPNAKINLGLNIVEKRPDGYHNLETIFYPIPVEDALEVHPFAGDNASYLLHQSGVEVAGDADSNLVVKAYRLLQSEFQLPPIEIFLHKLIPSGAGLVGGSADAAFMLKLLNERFELHLSDDALEERAATLGADCAFFIRNRPTLAESSGNLCSPIDLSLKGYQLLLMKLPIFVSTREAFALIKPHRPTHSLREVAAMPISEWRNYMINDFEESVFAQFPAIGELKAKIYEMGAVYAAMSGSGSSVFGLFAPDAVIPTIEADENTFVFQARL